MTTARTTLAAHLTELSAYLRTWCGASIWEGERHVARFYRLTDGEQLALREAMEATGAPSDLSGHEATLAVYRAQRSAEQASKAPPLTEAA